MTAQYQKIVGNCILCGTKAELYQQPEESGFRNWCQTCHERYRFLAKHRNDQALDSKTLFAELIAIQRQPLTK